MGVCLLHVNLCVLLFGLPEKGEKKKNVKDPCFPGDFLNQNIPKRSVNHFLSGQADHASRRYAWPPLGQAKQPALGSRPCTESPGVCFLGEVFGLFDGIFDIFAGFFCSV